MGASISGGAGIRFTTINCNSPDDYVGAIGGLLVTRDLKRLLVSINDFDSSVVGAFGVDLGSRMTVLGSRLKKLPDWKAAVGTLLRKVWAWRTRFPS